MGNSIKLAARAIVLNNKGQVLLTKRPLHDYEGGKWCLPGGKPNENEKLIDAALREVEEEVGLKVKLIFFKSYQFSKPGEEKVWETHYFVGNSNELPTEFNRDEVEEVNFFDKNELKIINIAFGHDHVLNEYFDLALR